MTDLLFAAVGGMLAGVALTAQVLMPRVQRRLEQRLAAREARMEIAMGAAKLGPVDLSGKTKEGGMKGPVILRSLQHQN